MPYNPDRSRSLFATVAGIATITAGSLAAQSAAPVPSDTGRMLTPYRDISRYTTPTMCVMGINRYRDLLWRRGEMDTLVISPRTDARRDTVPTAAVQFGRACAERFTVAQTDAGELFGLLRLALLIGDDAKAQAIVERQLTLSTTTVQRAGVLYDAITAYTVAYPRRRALANDAIARLDALGPDAKVLRFYVHSNLDVEAEEQSDDSTMTAEGGKAQALLRSLPQTEDYAAPILYLWANHDLYHRIFTTARDYRDGTQLKAHVDLIIDSLGRADEKFYTDPALQRLASQDTGGLRGLMFGLGGWQATGTPSPKIPVTYWYNKGGDTLVPTPGRVTLIAKIPDLAGSWDKPDDIEAPFVRRDLVTIRRLLARYEKDGLRVVMILPTAGYAWSSPVLTPKQEADLLAWYVLERLGLPVTVGVIASPAVVRPADGRRIVDQAAWQSLGGQGGIARVIGRDGTLQCVAGSLGADGLERCIRRELEHH